MSRERFGPGSAVLAVGVVVALGAAVAATYTRPGLAVASAVFWFLEFYSGVFSLVAMSMTVMGGLLMTDRMVLLVRHRVLLYAVHRALAMTAMLFLVIHILTKVSEQHASIIDVVVPFLSTHRPLYVGLGTIAGYLMTLAAWTGVIRGRFASSSRPWAWRLLHCASYLSWPVALVHGLAAGRPAKTWVLISYILCVILVAVGLAVRLAMYWGRRMRAPKATTTGTIKPVGRSASRSVPAPAPRPRSATNARGTTTGGLVAVTSGGPAGYGADVIESGYRSEPAPRQVAVPQPPAPPRPAPRNAGYVPGLGYVPPREAARPREAAPPREAERAYDTAERAYGGYSTAERSYGYDVTSTDPGYGAGRRSPRTTGSIPVVPPAPPAPPSQRPAPPSQRPAPPSQRPVPTEPPAPPRGTGRRTTERRFSDDEVQVPKPSRRNARPLTTADYWGAPEEERGGQRGGRGERGGRSERSRQVAASLGVDMTGEIAERFLGDAPMSPAPTAAGAPGGRWPRDPMQDSAELVSLPDQLRMTRDSVSDEEFWTYLRGEALR